MATAKVYAGVAIPAAARRSRTVVLSQTGRHEWCVRLVDDRRRLSVEYWLGTRKESEQRQRDLCRETNYAPELYAPTRAAAPLKATRPVGEATQRRKSAERAARVERVAPVTGRAPDMTVEQIVDANLALIRSTPTTRKAVVTVRRATGQAIVDRGAFVEPLIVDLTQRPEITLSMLAPQPKTRIGRTGAAIGRR